MFEPFGPSSKACKQPGPTTRISTSLNYTVIYIYIYIYIHIHTHTHAHTLKKSSSFQAFDSWEALRHSQALLFAALEPRGARNDRTLGLGLLGKTFSIYENMSI